jgi:tetratricopeptide (TPR) repeat protein
LFISPDGGVITNQGGYLPPEKFAPVMEEALNKEMGFKAKLAEYKKNPDDLKLNREIAILYINRQQFEKALPIGEKLPDDLELNSQFALAYLNIQQLDKALPFSEKVFAKDTKNESGNVSKLHTQIGLAYAMQLQKNPSDEKLAESAVMHLQQVIENFPESNEFEPSQYYLGVTYHIHMQFDKAIGVFEKLLNHGKNENLLRQAEMMLKRAQDSLASTPKDQ